MNTYIWRSEALADYTDGYIVSCGETVEEAIQKAMSSLKWDDLEEYSDLIQKDLQYPPTSINESYFIWGGS